MAKNLKEQRYLRILEQLKSLLTKTEDKIAKMATVAAVLKAKQPHFFWCGFYRVVDGELIVGPYQGSVACQVLEKDRGVCWHAVNTKKTVIVPDVEKFPGHIACDSRSKSEIVIPLFNERNEVYAVLDVDSDKLNSFDQIDAKYLEEIVKLI
ncbi:GAF domain-containing protein [Thermotomaculum hydrothermale]|uniref:GAF domain-containing protein n=1 Tax=Thermotomaculum hydrothermale TaxID=981385 RepID=A0A7R6SXR0_9BACT|nr:GAF domain-containing protein [Thermotomaculum hydrothermale]BBB31756.1 GAF domain-containing protein [Thermotomaculum hydrothermale]